MHDVLRQLFLTGRSHCPCSAGSKVTPTQKALQASKTKELLEGAEEKIVSPMRSN